MHLRKPVACCYSLIPWLLDRPLYLKGYFAVALIVVSAFSALAQQDPQTSDLPVISRISPAASAAGANVELEGNRLGANLDEGVRVLFIQGAAEYAAKPNGTGYDEVDGLHELNVIVPAQLQLGSCTVVVEVNGSRSAPFTIQIAAPAAPLIKDFRPHLPRAGEMVWIEGSGFSDSDTIELTDADGKTHRFEGGHTSNADTAAFPLPKDLPIGEATIRVLENRSGAHLSSNSLPVRIVLGPTPLSLQPGWLMPVAPGQWLDLVCTSFAPLESADRVEVLFQQRDQIVIVATKGTGENDLRVLVPEILAPGSVKIQTRTFSAGEVSPWSDAVEYQLLEKPAAAKIYSIEIRPVRAEAAFKQGDKTLAIVPVTESDYPRVRVPTDKLVPGLINVETRVWRGGQPSAWLFKGTGLFWPEKLLPDGTMGEEQFMQPVFLGPETKELTVYRGEKLILAGTFPTAAVDQVEVILQADSHAQIVFHPVEVTKPRGARISLPEDLQAGDWSVKVVNLDNRRKARATP